MSSVPVRGADARQFVKAFNDICQWNGDWERWNDMVNLFAIEISNTVDENNREERNTRYTQIASRYKPEEFKRFGDLFCLMIESLERNPFQDFLGTMYMELEMGSKGMGQCFTPYSICQMMAEMSLPKDKVEKAMEQRGWISLNDPAAGAGATLIAAAERLHQLGINYQQKALFVANDLDRTVAMMCYIQMSLIGCAGRVRIGDTLTEPETGDLLWGEGGSNTWYMPMFYTNPWVGRVAARHLERFLRSGRPETEPREPQGEEPGDVPEGKSEGAKLVEAKPKGRKVLEGQLMFDLTGGMA